MDELVEGEGLGRPLTMQDYWDAMELLNSDPEPVKVKPLPEQLVQAVMEYLHSQAPSEPRAADPA